MIKKLLIGMFVAGIVPIACVAFKDNKVLPQDQPKLVEATGNDPLETLTQSEYIKIAEALDVSLKNESVDMGDGYKLFDVKNEEFQNMFLVSSYSNQDSNSVIGHSSSEIASSFESKFGFGFGVDVGAPTPIGDVGFGVSSNFDRSASSSLSSVNDEYYEYWRTYKAVKIAQIDWKTIDVADLLTTQAKDEITAVNSIVSAVNFMKKYGTHLFDNYYFGGTLSISRYICSSASIAEDSSGSSVEFGLKTDIGTALSMNASGQNYSITNKEVNTNNTKTNTTLIVKGGNKLSGISPETIFTFKQEYASSYESGYVFAAWLDSISKCESLRVVKVAKPVAVWDVFKNSSLINGAQYSYFKEAFNNMCFVNYSNNCKELGIAPGYVKSISYSTNDYSTSFELNSYSVKLPEKAVATLEYGQTIIENAADDVVLTVKQGANYCSLDNNVLSIGDGAKDKTIQLSLCLSDIEIFTLDIVIGYDDTFARGYGTIDQPYLLSSSSEWNQFINNTDNYSNRYKNNFKLLNDIDLGGRTFTSGGASKKAKFYGTIDGGYHTIKNASVVYTGEWNNIGLIGVNCGKIKNLFVDNIKVMNSGVLTASKGSINAGVLVGRNYGTIEKVSITNSSIRIAGSLDEESTLNVGGLVGLNDTQSSTLLSSVRNTYVYGISYNNSGSVNVGGLIGSSVLSTINNVYAASAHINATNYFASDAKYYIDGRTNIVYEKQDNGLWIQFGTLGKDNLSYDSKTKTLKLPSGKSITNVVLGDGRPAISTIGGLIGQVNYGSAISFAILYDNSFNRKTNNFGFVAGFANVEKDKEQLSFENVFFEEISDKAVNEGTFDGCVHYNKVTLENIGNAEWNKLWTNNTDERPVLRWEVL